MSPPRFPRPPRRPSPPHPATKPQPAGEPLAAGSAPRSAPSSVPSPHPTSPPAVTPAAVSRLNPNDISFSMVGEGSARPSGKETLEWLRFGAASSSAASSSSSRSVASSLLPPFAGARLPGFLPGRGSGKSASGGSKGARSTAAGRSALALEFHGGRASC